MRKERKATGARKFGWDSYTYTIVGGRRGRGGRTTWVTTRWDERGGRRRWVLNHLICKTKVGGGDKKEKASDTSFAIDR